ncbi:MAG: cupin domain-containing protein [Deltaproteobacteria bacterium]|nr:cupin domain-containing protein [Deltaproteobacteria bacterium]
MDKPEGIKNVSFSEAHFLKDLVDYQQGRVVSRTLAQNEALSLTLFAFDQREGLSTHAAPGDAMVQVLDGQVSLTTGGKQVTAKAGEVVVMPADIPHSVKAVKPFKMLLTVVKKPKGK